MLPRVGIAAPPLSERVGAGDEITAGADGAELVPLETLRERARAAIDPGQRGAAALALAVLDDEVAYSVVRSDPVGTIRDQVGRMLTGWRHAPEPASPS